MSLTTYEKEVEHLRETQGVKDHDHDMVHDLSRRLDALWRYDQYVANAEGIKIVGVLSFSPQILTMERRSSP